MEQRRLKVMVLAGGPDREREVSLASGREVAAALAQHGHDVRLRDVTPEDLAALEEFESWPGDALFPALHGPWGEGGELQRILDQRALPYIGSRAAAASRCMDKEAAKRALIAHELPTPPFEVVDSAVPTTLDAPLVIKPLCEGSSIDVSICPNAGEARRRRAELGRRHGRLLIEKMVEGIELTVGVVGGLEGASPGGDQPLPPIQILPAAGFYDYQAKYARDDTRYCFDIALPPAVLDRVRDLARQAHVRLGCRDLSRVDFMVDREHRPWILEINTIPGFTTHSLVPKAAAHAGLSFAELCDRLVRLAARPS